MTTSEGSPVTATDNAAVVAVRNAVEADRRVTIDEIMIRLPPGIEIRRSSIGTIMSDVLNFLKVCTRWVPRLFLENHKQQRMEAARAFLEMHQRDGDQLFSRIVTGDESWVHHSTPETKRQSMVWKKPEESAPKKAKVTISAGKVMAMENFKWEIFTHPPYSPELAPSDFHLYPALKWHLGGKHFANDDEVQAEANHWLRRQDTAWYNSGIKKLLQRYQKCLDRNGWLLHFKVGPTLLGQRVRLYTNHPASAEAPFDRTTYRELKWESEGCNQSDLTGLFAELLICRAGSFHYYFTLEGEYELAEAMGISGERVQNISHEELGMRRLCTRNVIASVFWDAKGILLIDYLELGGTITGEYYSNLLDQLDVKIRKKGPSLKKKKIIFHLDNAPAHKNVLVMGKLLILKYDLLDHPSYSPDLAPSDFHLLPYLKKYVSGKCFAFNEDVERAVDEYSNSSLPDFHFLEGILILEKHWANRPFSCLYLGHTQSLHPLLTSTQQPYFRIMSSQKRKCESITMEKKKEICQLARNNPMKSKNEIGERFSLPRTTVHDILTQAEKWENYTVGSSKRQRVRKFSDLEDTLLNWFTQKRANNIIITDDLL
ncbi:hypothetical protein LAZ67_10001302 [Cordylochernes scorpioides]|uniref:HTH CENPB-type domain-containing protein n=1 Tax=Cordylochernes scorpioides TaxID=51811 RepID=A0ABY6KWA2_9ARAC|nr:hypothetical protein LAZ67_10001302 [Cordylochernes scorpioides]